MILPRRALLAAALAAALASTAVPSAPPIADAPAERAVWIVRFAEPAVASYTGVNVKRGGRSLAATSPAVTGAARLDFQSAAVRAYREELALRRESRLQAAEARLGRDLEPTAIYDAVLNGMAVELTPAEAALLAEVPGVVAVERERIEWLQDDVSTALVQAPQVWSGAAGVASRGEGVVVGVIDSGIHPSHPAFAATAPVDGHVHANPKGRFFGLCASAGAACNSKLIGIWDFTTGGSDSEPNDGIDLDGHGTHVAGTAVGNAVNMVRAFAGGGQVAYTIRGVAPRANLITYKACEDDGCAGSWTLAALNQAVLDGVDVINYSIGGSNVNPWSSSGALAMLDARNAGIVVAVSAGNSGPDVGTVRSPSDAPWVVSVANSSHGRRYVNRLRLSGGATLPPFGGVIEGEGLTAGTGPAALARDPSHPLCSRGTGDVALPLTGASNPWPANRWNGQIVLCDRGVQARVAKSNNVRLSGGSGTVLLNTAAEGEATAADEHSIPTTHIGFAAGQAVLQWLATGSGHSARIDGATVDVAAANANVLNASSGRGPSVVLPAVIKPDLAAPGTSILSAARVGSGDAVLSGTSMSAPHMAGAAALLRGARPGWRADQIISALMTTAMPAVTRTRGGAPVHPHDQGSGRIDLERAVRAGLAFAMRTGEFASGSSAPAALNLPSMVFDGCAPGCTTLSRTVTDLVGGGTWRVRFEGPAGVTVSPSAAEFTLAAGASRTLQFTASIDDPSAYGRWLYGSLVLSPAAGGVAEARVPVALRARATGLPASVARAVAADRGHFDLALPGLNLPLPNARFAGTRLVAPVRTSHTLTVDPTPSDRYDNLSNGVGWHAFAVPTPADGAATRYRIEVELQSPAGTQASLLFGNGGTPGSRNQICESATRCAFEVEHPGNGPAQSYWAMVWNRAGSGMFTVSHSVLPLTPAPDAEPARLTATGPGTANVGEGSNVRIGWQDAAWPAGEQRRGALLVSAAPGVLPMAAVPVTLTRGAGDAAAQALASGVPVVLGLSPSGSHERVFIDVPAGATELRVSAVSAANVDLFLARRDFVGAGTEAAQAVPNVLPAPPRGEAVRSAAGPGGDERIVVSNPPAGRWYVTPVNAAGEPASVTVTATVAGSAPAIRPGGYFNPGRSGHGVFLYPAQTEWAGLWYTYLQDGSSTWYYAQGPRPGANGLWRGTLYRSAWNGRSNVLTVVGEVAVTPTANDAFTWTYTLDGETGAEPFVSFGRGCPSIEGRLVDASGHWFDPARSGTGYSVQIFTNYEFYAVFAYDARGVPRFLVAERSGIGAPTQAVPLEQLTGFCPLCPRAAAPLRAPIGSLERRFDNGVLRGLTLGGTFTGGVPGSWSASDTVTPLGDLQGCP